MPVLFRHFSPGEKRKMPVLFRQSNPDEVKDAADEVKDAADEVKDAGSNHISSGNGNPLYIKSRPTPAALGRRLAWLDGRRILE